jgi:hypothetical protein
MIEDTKKTLTDIDGTDLQRIFNRPERALYSQFSTKVSPFQTVDFVYTATKQGGDWASRSVNHPRRLLSDSNLPAKAMIEVILTISHTYGAVRENLVHSH